MKVLLVFALLAVVAQAAELPSVVGYLAKYAIPQAEKIRKAEEEYAKNPSKIAGGLPASLGDRPFQVGLAIDIIGLDGVGVCGGSILSAKKVVTAAHCWYDGENQGWRLTVVAGSTLLFSGGTRIQTSDVETHETWIPLLILNDIAMITLPEELEFSDIIAPVALPSGEELTQSWAGTRGVVSGFGALGDGISISVDQFLSQVSVAIIENSVCNIPFLGVIRDSNICTSGIGGTSPCGGDSGGPLTVNSNGRDVLLGVVSFGSVFGCTIGFPGVYVRVPSYIDWITYRL